MEAPQMVQPGGHVLPPLPYQNNALEPVISAASLRIHHDILHKKYVDGLNTAERRLVEARRDRNFELIRYFENELAFNGSGHILHSIFWTVMAPPGRGGAPGNITMTQLINYFGSFDGFAEQFAGAASKIEGSCWAILTWQPAFHRLEILQAEKHQNNAQWGGIPILVLDVWEHAYYLDYQTRRDAYIEKWWSLVDWTQVESRLRLAMSGQVKLTL